MRRESLRRSAALVALATLAIASARCGASDEEPGLSPDAATTDAPQSDAAEAASCSTDVKSDPKHCGRCDHDCLGGACVEGACQPVILAGGQARAVLVGVDATHVYWEATAAIDGGTAMALRRTPKSGGAIEEALQQGGRSPVLGTTELYWTEKDSNGTITRIAAISKTLVGPARTVVARDTATMMPEGFIGASGDQVLLNNRAPNDSPLKIERIHPDGQVQHLFSLPNLNTTEMGTLIATSQHVFVSGPRRVLRGDNVVAGGGQLDGGGMPQAITLATAEAFFPGIATDGVHVFFTESQSGSVSKVPVGGGAASKIAVGQAQPGAIAVDAVAVYFANYGANEIASCPVTGCGNGPSRVIAERQFQPNAIAVDETAVYWSTDEGGSIGRVAK
jgi:hypothetical protein